MASDGYEFPWLLLILLLVSVVVSVIFLFYFNRAFGKLVSILIRLVFRWWKWEVYFDVQSIQISLLAGRIFFGKVVYHGTNESIIIVNGHVTWRYWYRKVRHCMESEGESETAPCRIQITAHGVEWYIYNRTASYDSIISQMDDSGSENVQQQFDTNEEATSNIQIDSGSGSVKNVLRDRRSASIRQSRDLGEKGRRSTSNHMQASAELTAAEKLMLQILPLQFVIEKGAIVMGNANTPSILVARFADGTGTANLLRSRFADKFKQVFDFDIKSPVIEFKENQGYTETLLEHGQRLASKVEEHNAVLGTGLWHTLRNLPNSAFEYVGNVASSAREKNERSQETWRGLSRYLEGAHGSDTTEYAKVTTIAECPEMSVKYYWDNPGVVVPGAVWSDQFLVADDINSGPPPEFGVDIVLKGGKINYGPWADRQRIQLQNMFFPKLYKNATMMRPLKPGDVRVFTIFEVFVDIRDSTTLHVPTREASKDWKYKPTTLQSKRPYGWLELKVKEDSSVRYEMAMVPGRENWKNTLKIELKGPELRTSVNDGLLYKAGIQTIKADLPSELRWKDPHQWTFNIDSRIIDLFLLREHIILFTDLVNDWGTGPVPGHSTWVAFKYILNLKLTKFRALLNVNDGNIINSPDDFGENTFLVLKGEKLYANVDIPLDRYRPAFTEIPFVIRAPHVLLDLSLPPWNTRASFVDSTSVGSANNLKVSGSYHYATANGAGLIDTLSLDVGGREVFLRLDGVLIRYFLSLQKNYFGENLHFRTLEEHYEALKRVKTAESQGTAIPASSQQAHYTKTNDIDVLLHATIENNCIFLPSNVYSAERNIRLDVPCLSLDLRFTNYYMDLQVDISPTGLSVGHPLRDFPEIYPAANASNPLLFVDGITIYGHRLFGLPPVEPTYVCDWNLKVGSVTGECTTEFLKSLVTAMKAFVFGVEDVENALPSAVTHTIHDATFLKLSLESLRVLLRMDSRLFLAKAGQVKVDFNDLVGDLFSEKVSLSIPGLSLACLDGERLSDYGERGQPVTAPTDGYIAADITVSVFNSANGMRQKRVLQQRHIKEHDFRTGRTQFLLQQRRGSEDTVFTNEYQTDEPPSMALPTLPRPLTGTLLAQDRLSSMERSSRATISSGKKSSFMSSIRSVRRDGDSRTSFHSAVQSQGHFRSSMASSRTLANVAYPFSTHGYGDLVNAPGSPELRRNTSGNVHISTRYVAPPFELLDVLEPELDNVPALPDTEEVVVNEEFDPYYDETTLQQTEEGQLGLVVEFEKGIRGFCNPNAAKAVAALIEALHPQSIEDVLDELQIVIVERLAGLRTRKIKENKTIDICIKLPHFRFRVFNEIPKYKFGHGNMSGKYGDAVDISMFNAQIVGRSREPKVQEHEIRPTKQSGNILSWHVLIDNLTLGMTHSRPGKSEVQPAPSIQLSLNDILFWASTNKNATASLQMKLASVLFESTQIPNILESMERGSEVLEEIEAIFSELQANERKRTQHAVYCLAVAGEEMRLKDDPSSITRPSNVLRSTLDHVRVNDSWKIMGRIRNIYKTLPSEQQELLNLHCSAKSPVILKDSQTTVIKALEQWRSWELTNIASSYFVQKVFRLKSPTKSDPFAGKLQLSLDQFHFYVDPTGVDLVAAMHDISVHHMLATIGINLSNVGPEAVNFLFQGHCGSMESHLRWEILELVRLVTDYFDSYEGSLFSASKVPKKQPRKTTPKLSGHVVLTADSASLLLESVNLKLSSMVHNFRCSTVVSNKNPTLDGLAVGALVALEGGSSELSNVQGGRLLGVTSFRRGSLHLNYNERDDGNIEHKLIKVIGICDAVNLDFREQILGLLEVVDLVVGDEIAQIHQLLQRMENSSKTRRMPSVKGKTNRQQKSSLSVDAFFNLNDFSLCIALLPSLAYMLRGGGAQLVARTKGPSETTFDFDLLHHEHEVRTSDTSETRSISILQMPLISGRVHHQESSTERLVESWLSIDAVQLEASAIQSLLNALNKPEIVTVAQDAKTEWEMTLNRINEIYGTRTPTKESLKKRVGPDLAYRVQVGIEGFKILTSAPSADFEVNLGSVQLQASNKPRRSKTILEMPEIFVDFRQITAQLVRTIAFEEPTPCGYFEVQASLKCSSKLTESGNRVRTYHIKSNTLRIDAHPDTANTVIEIASHLQDRLKDLDLSKEVRHFRKMRKRSKPPVPKVDPFEKGIELLSSIFSVDMQGIQFSWIVGDSVPEIVGSPRHNLVMTLKRINLATDILKQNEARLSIEEVILQLAEEGKRITERGLNSALMPKVEFQVQYAGNELGRSLKLQAMGRSLDLRLNSSCVVPMKVLERSMAIASKKFRIASSSLKSKPTPSGKERKNLFGTKRLASLLIDADFAGAVVYLQGSGDRSITVGGVKIPQFGPFSQFTTQGETEGTVLRSPRLALKLQYTDPLDEDPSINGEIEISGSKNVLYPSVVSMIMEMTDRVKELVLDEEKPEKAIKQKGKDSSDEQSAMSQDPAAILGTIRLNVGLRIREQEFSLSCQPIARVTATARYNDIYIAINTCEDPVGGRFYSISGNFNALSCSLQHVYSRESTGHIEVDTLVVYLMNSKHLGGRSGLSCAIKSSPVRAQLNVKQIQDFLLFREIWIPPELRSQQSARTKEKEPDSPTQLVQRYHKVAATSAFPWNTTVIFSSLNMQLDVGPSIGRVVVDVTHLWLSSRKTSDWMQTMCFGMDSLSVRCTGRLGGLLELNDLRARTSIKWATSEDTPSTPLIEAAIAFERFRTKVSFEYQEFLVAEVARFDFLMYNLRKSTGAASDQLVGMLTGDKVNVFCTALSASQAVALHQAFKRLYEEKQASFQNSLRDVEKFLNRRTQTYAASAQGSEGDIQLAAPIMEKLEPEALSLHTNVLVHLKEVNVGVFPGSFGDSQIFKLEASEIGAHFAVAMENEKLHSHLGMTLGQLRVALSPVKKVESGTALGEFNIDSVISNARDAKGGTILKVPHVQAQMHTWHVARSNQIDYTFKSAFEGKVDVGWNYARVSFIRGMWATNMNALAQRQGKSLPSSTTFRIDATNMSPVDASFPGDALPSETGSAKTGREGSAKSEKSGSGKDKDKPKITAVVNVPQSRYIYRPLEPPVIETPQLRDMGEATPPLEWIGLNRDRLPNLTHQIVIVSLLEVAREVEDAYFKILG